MPTRRSGRGRKAPARSEGPPAGRRQGSATRPVILVLHGPNLNLIGEREPRIYGRTTLEEINQELRAQGEAAGVDVQVHQSNHEGVLIDLLHQARRTAAAVVINAGAFTHTSIALRDAIAASELPVEAVFAKTVSPEIQRRKLFALESMHDLRLSPSEQDGCLPPGIQTRRDDYPRTPDVDYLRRGPRSEELFFVYGRDAVRDLIRAFLAARKEPAS